MKKKFVFFLLLIFSMCFILINFYTGNLTHPKKNMKVDYYTSKLIKSIDLQPNYKCILLDTNFYREENLEKEHLSTVKNFLTTLNKNSFILYKKNSFPKEPIYKMFLIFDEEKFVINVYNKNYVSIHCWDGYHEMDCINMSSIPYSYNLYNLCNFLIPNKN